MPDDENEEKHGLLSGVSPAQVVGSALAAVTSAFAASGLGVAGTLIGAAIGSIVITVGGAFYTNSLRRQGAKIAAAAGASTRVALNQAQKAQGGTTPYDGAEVDPGTGPADDATAPLDAAGFDASFDDAGFDEDAAPGDADAEAVGTTERKGLIGPKTIIAAIGVSLALALGGIWAYETIVGHPISNSGGSGTTFSNIGRSNADGKNQKNQDSDSPSQGGQNGDSDSDSEGGSGSSGGDSSDEEAPSTEAPTEEPTTEAPTEEPTTEAPTTPAPAEGNEGDVTEGQGTPGPSDAKTSEPVVG
ncbi:hypothetical protein CLV56_0127 [Mumia flava]|uniref:Uncharacterized protein n=2 Tax=Mumia flava TaxID=1348852 RepID=A0A0B2B8A7_9ACTN|nr:hypothetical protein CLV56_0127 [Mumia flava]